MVTHAQIPVADLINGDMVRIYFGVRDRYNRTSTTYIEAKADNPSKVLYVHDKPVLSPGKLGTFDDRGAMPSCIVTHRGRKYFYFIGWNVSTTVRYRNSIGLAVSDDDGRTFRRLFEGPIMDRTHIEPYFVVTPYVVVEDGIWRMWYCGCTGWSIEKGITEPRYQIPHVVKENGIYRMLYCYRSISDYRIDKERSYRIGYAESPDGKTWKRKDDEVGIDRSEEGWDSEMMAYPYLYEYKGKKYMLYNGNGFGKSGFGYAVSEEG
jgi:hypothetical protein